MLEQFMAMVNACGEDIAVYQDGQRFDLTFNDFDGFDEHWSEIFREYAHPQEMEALMEWLALNCVRFEDGYYATYYFYNFSIQIGYASMEI